jgi:ribosomal protein S18 acetylase RimI-like enzyme
MTPSVEIVEASSRGELEAVRTLFLAYREGLFSKCQIPDAEWQSLPGAYSPPAGGLLLAKVDGNPAGCVGLRPFPEPSTGEMKRLYVAQEFRGLHLGEALVNAVIQMARGRGYSRMRLDTHASTMQAAIALYRRLGFREVAPDPLTPTEDLLYMAVEFGANPRG